MDLWDDPNSPYITAALELPGLKKEDITIELQNDLLTVRAHRKSYNPVVPRVSGAGVVAHHNQTSTSSDANSRAAAVAAAAIEPGVPPIVHELQYGPVRRFIKMPGGIQVGY